MVGLCVYLMGGLWPRLANLFPCSATADRGGEPEAAFRRPGHPGQHRREVLPVLPWRRGKPQIPACLSIKTQLLHTYSFDFERCSLFEIVFFCYRSETPLNRQ